MAPKTAEAMIDEMDKPEDINECVPCKVQAAIGVLLGAYCEMDAPCMELADQVLDGKITIRDMAERLEVVDVDIEALEDAGVPIDELKEWRKDIPKEKDDFVASVNKINEQYQKQTNTEEGGD